MKEGRVYFALQFSDPGLLVPELRPIIFLGDNLYGEDPSLRWFQDFDAYRAGVRYEDSDPEERQSFHVYGPADGQHIFEYGHALKGLMWCALSRDGIENLDEHILRSATERLPER